MNEETNRELVAVLKREMVDAMGCTEPAAAALAAAAAASALRSAFGLMPERITVAASRDMIKNAMSVELPNASLKGLKAAVALGAMGGSPQERPLGPGSHHRGNGGPCPPFTR
jgi:L-cysteine desulfidase